LFRGVASRSAHTHTGVSAAASQPATTTLSAAQGVAGKRVARTKAALRAGEHLCRNGSAVLLPALPSPLPSRTPLAVRGDKLENHGVVESSHAIAFKAALALMIFYNSHYIFA
jgi:hypothetical protein